MSPSRPEADVEYSRGPARSGSDLAGSNGGAGGRSSALAIAVLGGGMLGAVLLLVAEFTPLLQVHSSARTGVVETIDTGAHHSYALVPIAVLALALAFSGWRSRSRLALLATGVLGLVALLIALLGDLPDAHASGLIGTAAGSFADATSSASIGLYLETLGAIVLLITAAAGLLLLEPPPRPPRRARKTASSSRTRSAS
jgi:hypothetical protein